MSEGLTAFLQAVGERVRHAGVFGSVTVRDSKLICAAKNAAEPAEYRLSEEAAKLWVSLVTPNRWLSESIESDLEHTGDEVEELVEEELVELDYHGEPMHTFQHFRDDEKLFTFRSVVPVPTGAIIEGAAATDAKSIETAEKCLLAYEACFRRLGDMEAGEEA